MKGGPKSSLRPFLHRALQLYNNVKQEFNTCQFISFISSCQSLKTCDDFVCEKLNFS